MENQVQNILKQIIFLNSQTAQLTATVTQFCLHLPTQTTPPDTKPQEPDLLTIKEAAKILRKSDKTVLNWIKQGKIPAITSNPSGKRQHFTIRRQVIEDYISNNTT